MLLWSHLAKPAKYSTVEQQEQKNWSFLKKNREKDHGRAVGLCQAPGLRRKKDEGAGARDCIGDDVVLATGIISFTPWFWNAFRFSIPIFRRRANDNPTTDQQLNNT